MEQFVVVIEPGARSVQTYKNVKRLAEDLGVKKVRVVANKVRGTEDEEFVRSKIPAEDLLGFIHYNPEVIDADRQASHHMTSASLQRGDPNESRIHGIHRIQNWMN